MSEEIRLSSQVSILIPTMDRSLFVIRALYFYMSVGFKGCICIGDSSKTDEFLRTQREVLKLTDKLQIIHQFYPSSDYPNEAVVVKSLIAVAPTEYVCQYGDDDFLIPSGITECVRFLDENRDYVAACGRTRIEFRLKDNELFFGEIDETIKVDENDFDRESANERFITYMRNAVAPTYNVFRKEIFENVYKKADVAITRYFGPEVLVSAIAALSGRTKTLNVFTVMFQVHDRHIFGWDEQSIYNMLVEPTFSDSIGILREQFVQYLVEKDGMPHDECLEIVDRELWGHIYRMLAWQYKDKYLSGKPGQSATVIGRIKRIRGVGRPMEISAVGFYWWVRKFIHQWVMRWDRKRCTAQSLRQPGSVFYKDFSFVSNFLSAPPKEVAGTYENKQPSRI